MVRIHAALLLVAAVACGPKERVGADLDTAEVIPRRAVGCKVNCQSVHWMDREVIAALSDISVCLPEPTYAPAALRGEVTVAFRDLPCRQAVARVAAAAGLEVVVSTVNGERAVVLRPARRPAGALVLLPK